MTDYFIIGQGLAGSVLSSVLTAMGQKVTVFDEYRETSSSMIAAGIINPVTGRNLVTTWMAKEILPIAFEYYRDMEKILGGSYLKIFPMMRILKNESETSLYYKQAVTNPYLSPPEYDSKVDKVFNAPDGVIEINPSARLSMKEFLLAYRDVLKKDNSLIEGPVDYNSIKFEGEYVKIDGKEARNIIFCDGWTGNKNPFFPGLPFAPTKGEILTISSTLLPQNTLYMKHHYILPIGNHQFKVGATYNWDNTDPGTTPEAREIIKSKLDKTLKVPYEIIGHEAAVRPNTIDRKPLIGVSKVQPQCVLFNGMGSKGASLAPYFARHLAQHLVQGEELMPEVAYDRRSRSHRHISK